MTLNIGFIGTGGFANVHMKCLQAMEDVKVASLYNRTFERAESAAAAYPGAKAYRDLTEMLDDRKLDAVYVCVTPEGHGPIEQRLVERNIPFLTEKPLGVDYDIPSQIGELVASKGLITSVGYHKRYEDTTTHARTLLAERTVGMALGYWMGDMPMVPWWRNQVKSGGQFVEQTTHIVDLLRFLCGEVTEVYAAYAQRHMPSQVENVTVADVGTVTLKLASGAVANLSNTCMLPMGHRAGLDLYTEKGVIEINGDFITDMMSKSTVINKKVNDPYMLENEAFIHAIRTGDTSRILSSYADALKSQQVAAAANKSALTGKPVTIG